MTARTRQVALRGKSENGAVGLVSASGDAAIVERGTPRLLVMRCPCGCGDDLLINLDRRAGPAWRSYVRGNKLTIFPSYWREDACESHFILWSDRIFWCGFRSEDDDFWVADKSVENAV